MSKPTAEACNASAAGKRSAKAESRKLAVDTLARTIYGEARGESVRGKEAVAAVVLNRVRRAETRGGWWWGNSITEVCRKPWQFSCWNANDPNLGKIRNVDDSNRVFRSCLRIAERAVSGTLSDPTQGATHYHAEGVHPPWAWRKAPSVHIGGHYFYNNIE